MRGGEGGIEIGGVRLWRGGVINRWGEVCVREYERVGVYSLTMDVGC